MQVSLTTGERQRVEAYKSAKRKHLAAQQAKDKANTDAMSAAAAMGNAKYGLSKQMYLLAEDEFRQE